MIDRLSRREFLSVKVLRAFSGCCPCGTISMADEKAQEIQRYFQSPLYSYPLLQEMPTEMLVEEALSRGIAVKGRSKNDIARELFMARDHSDR